MRIVVCLLFIIVLCAGLGEKPGSDFKGSTPTKSGRPESQGKDKKDKLSKSKTTGTSEINSDKATKKPQINPDPENILPDQTNLNKSTINTQVDEANPPISYDKDLEQTTTENNNSNSSDKNKEDNKSTKEDDYEKVEGNSDDEIKKKNENEKDKDRVPLEIDTEEKKEKTEVEVNAGYNNKETNEKKENAKNVENVENVESVENDENIENVESAESVENVERAENDENVENVENHATPEEPLPESFIIKMEDLGIESLNDSVRNEIFALYLYDMHDHSLSDHNSHYQEADSYQIHDQEHHSNHLHEIHDNHFHSDEENNRIHRNDVENRVNIDENHEHETFEPEKNDTNFTSNHNSQNIIADYLILFAETTESYAINALKITQGNELSRIAIFYLFFFIVIWLLLPIKKLTDYKITTESDSSSVKTLEKLIDDQYEMLRAAITQKQSTPKEESSDAQYLSLILDNLERIKDLEAGFQVQVIDSHKEIWDAIDARKTPLSPPRHITLSIPFT